LHVSDVGGESGYKRSGGKIIDILKGVGLDLSEKIAAKVLCKSRARLCAGESRDSAAAKRCKRHADKQCARQKKLAHLGSRLDGVYEVCGDKGDKYLNYDLADNEDQGKYRWELVFPDTPKKSFYHFGFPFCPFGKYYYIIYYTKIKLTNQYENCRKQRKDKGVL
jgi:hypothetical protein